MHAGLTLDTDLGHNIYRLLLDDKLVAAPLRDPEHALDSKRRFVNVDLGMRETTDSSQLIRCVEKSGLGLVSGHCNSVSILGTRISSIKTPQ